MKEGKRVWGETKGKDEREGVEVRGNGGTNTESTSFRSKDMELT